MKVPGGTFLSLQPYRSTNSTALMIHLTMPLVLLAANRGLNPRSVI